MTKNEYNEYYYMYFENYENKAAGYLASVLICVGAGMLFWFLDGKTSKKILGWLKLG